MSAIITLNEIIESIRSEIKVTVDGKGFFTNRALSRIADVDEKALRYSFASENRSSKLNQKLTEYGFDPADFIISGIPDRAAYVILTYYAHDAGKRCTEMAKKSVEAIGSMGMRQWCRTVTGWSADKRETVSVDTVTAESMFARMMEMDQKMNQILLVAEKQVETLTAQVVEQKLITAAKQNVINDMVEKENIRDAKFLLYPGLKEAVDFAIAWDEEKDEEIFFTLKQFCVMRELTLSRGQKIQIGKLATDFCRLAIMRKMPKSVCGHTLYSSRFEPILKLAIVEVLDLKR